jgi:hypothetical protein
MTRSKRRHTVLTEFAPITTESSASRRTGASVHVVQFGATGCGGGFCTGVYIDSMVTLQPLSHAMGPQPCNTSINGGGARNSCRSRRRISGNKSCAHQQLTMSLAAISRLFRTSAETKRPCPGTASDRHTSKFCEFATGNQRFCRRERAASPAAADLAFQNPVLSR